MADPNETPERLQSAVHQISIPDIMGEIFELVAAEAFLSDVVSFHCNVVPLTLSHVCRIWRDIALSMTAIWSRIHLKLGQPICNIFGKRQSALLQSSLHNSKGHDLMVHISGFTHDITGEELDLLEIILRTSPRWVALYRHLAISEDNLPDRFSALWRTLEGNLGRLKVLELRVSSLHNSAFRDLPSLESFEGPDLWKGVCYPNLETLRTEDLPAFFNFAPGCLRLRSVALSNESHWYSGSYSLVHDNLRSLSLPQNMMANAKVDFSLPALNILSFDLGANVFADVDSLFKLEQGLAHVQHLSSQCQLRSLTVSLAIGRFPTVQSPTFCRSLQGNLSHLTHLHLVESVDENSAISDLHLNYLLSTTAGTGSGSGLLPNLTDLTYHLHDNGGSSLVYEMVLKYVSSRWNIEGAGIFSAKLKRFSFLYSSDKFFRQPGNPIPETFLEGLGILLDRGLNVSAHVWRSQDDWDAINIWER